MIQSENLGYFEINRFKIFYNHIHYKKIKKNKNLK